MTALTLPAALRGYSTLSLASGLVFAGAVLAEMSEEPRSEKSGEGTGQGTERRPRTAKSGR